MWVIWGTGAIFFTILNIIWAVRKKEEPLFLILALSMTALTLSAFYSDAAHLVVHEDWSALIDIMPTMEIVLRDCTVVSIVLNGAANIYSRMMMKK